MCNMNRSIVSRAPGFKVIAVPVTLLLLMLASGFAVGSGDHAGEQQKAAQGKDSKSDAAATHDVGGGNHADGHKADHGKDSKSDTGVTHGAGGGAHRHASWQTPPTEYMGKRNRHWKDPKAVARGKALYQMNCLQCHGADGRGTGPSAKALKHPPADLTNHFHTKPGVGDAYLFWRVSEGGLVEPFKSMGSSMPAFKGFMSESQRWDVLTYVHVNFHSDW